MNLIRNLSCFGGSLPSTPDQARSERTSGTAMGRNVIVRDKKELSLLLDLPLEIQSKIYSYLQAHDITRLTRVNSYMNSTIKNDTSIARAWYRQFPSSQQALMETIVTAKDKDQLEDWLRRFTKDEALIKSIMDCQTSVYFPALFFSSITKLMSECKTFKLETKATLPIFATRNLHTTATKKLASFGLDSRHILIVSDNKTLKIYCCESWTVKATISHDNSINEATFSASGRHVVTASNDKTAKIYAL
uniref:WD40 repeat domain-containing protein n=1 Tax=unclassified Endozoicomonas TaxID=2644528 RepID=UPI00214955E7